MNAFARPRRSWRGTVTNGFLRLSVVAGLGGQRPFRLLTTMIDLGNRRTGSIYIGPTILTSHADAAPQGEVGVGFQVSGPDVPQQDDGSGTPVTCASYAGP